MSRLINQLLEGTREYKDEGIVITHPPTSLAIRAATHIKDLETQHQIDVKHIQQLQLREEQDALERIGRLGQIADLNKYIKELENELQSLRESTGKDSNLVRGRCTEPSGGDGSSLENAEPESTTDVCGT